jgi:coenzyme F420-dependent glucose-6-phosphate dehydrogenase
VKVGYTLSSEEHRPDVLARNARAAEAAGFEFDLVSDHFHPWSDRQGQSPFVWTMIGAIAQSTETLAAGTGVTCPSIRVHPAILAQAAATSAAQAGLDHVYIHQIGPDQGGFLRFYEREILPVAVAS